MFSILYQILRFKRRVSISQHIGYQGQRNTYDLCYVTEYPSDNKVYILPRENNSLER